MVAYGCEWPRCGFNAMQPMPLCGCVNAHMLAFVYNASCALAFKLYPLWGGGRACIHALMQGRSRGAES